MELNNHFSPLPTNCHSDQENSSTFTKTYIYLSEWASNVIENSFKFENIFDSNNIYRLYEKTFRNHEGNPSVSTCTLHQLIANLATYFGSDLNDKLKFKHNDEWDDEDSMKVTSLILILGLKENPEIFTKAAKSVSVEYHSKILSFTSILYQSKNVPEDLMQFLQDTTEIENKMFSLSCPSNLTSTPEKIKPKCLSERSSPQGRSFLDSFQMSSNSLYSSKLDSIMFDNNDYLKKIIDDQKVEIAELLVTKDSYAYKLDSALNTVEIKTKLNERLEVLVSDLQDELDVVRKNQDNETLKNKNNMSLMHLKDQIIAEAEAKLSKQSHEIDNLNKEICLKNEDVKHYEEKCHCIQEEFQEKMSDYRSQVFTLQNELSKKESDARQLMEENARHLESTMEVDRIKELNAHLQGKLDRMSSSIQNLEIHNKSKFQKLSDEYETLKNKMESNEADSNNQIDILEVELCSYRHKYGNLETQNKGLQEQIQEKNVYLRKMNEELAQVNHETLNVHNSYQKKISDIEAKFDDARKDLHTEKEKSISLQSKCDHLQNELNQLQSRLANVTENWQKAESQIRHLKENISAASENTKASREDLINAKNTIESLGQRISTLETQKKMLVKKVQNVPELTLQRDELAMQLSVAKDNQRNLIEKIVAAENDIEKLNLKIKYYKTSGEGSLINTCGATKTGNLIEGAYSCLGSAIDRNDEMQANLDRYMKKQCFDQGQFNNINSNQDFESLSVVDNSKYDLQNEVIKNIIMPEEEQGSSIPHGNLPPSSSQLKYFMPKCTNKNSDTGPTPSKKSYFNPNQSSALDSSLSSYSTKNKTTKDKSRSNLLAFFHKEN